MFIDKNIKTCMDLPQKNQQNNPDFLKDSTSLRMLSEQPGRVLSGIL